MVGTFGKAGCFSLHPLKSLGGAGDGGFVATNDKKLYKKIYRLRNHGQISREDIAHYGFCSRLDNIQAAILNIKFKSFKSNIIKRRKIASIYSNNLKNLPLILECPFSPRREQLFPLYFILVHSEAGHAGNNCEAYDNKNKINDGDKAM